MSEFKEYDGVEIPLRMVKSAYGFSDKRTLKAQPEEEAFLERFKKDNIEVKVRQSLTVSPESVRINPPNTPKDLRIVFPKGTTVVDKLLGTDFVVGRSAEQEVDVLVKEAVSAIGPVAKAATLNGTPAGPHAEPARQPAMLLTQVHKERSFLYLFALLGILLGIALGVILALRRKSRA